jgi:hypothetical protein
LWRTIITTAASTALAAGIVLGLELYKGAGEVRIPTFGSVESANPVNALMNFAANGFGLRKDETGEFPGRVLRPLLIGLAGLVVLGAIQLARQPGRRWQVILLAGLVVVPLGVLIGAASLVIPIWQVRYATPMLATMAILVIVSFASIRPRWVGIVSLAILTISAAILTTSLFSRGRYQRDDWRADVGYIVDHLEPGDEVYACRGFPSQALLYYAPTLNFYRIGTKPTNHPIDRPNAEGTIPESVRRAWVIGHMSECTFKQYGIRAPGMARAKEAGGPFHNVTIRLYERK